MDTNKVLEKMRMLKLQETIKIIENRIVNQADKREFEQALLENKCVNVKYMGKAEFEGKWQDIYKIFEQYQKDVNGQKKIVEIEKYVTEDLEYIAGDNKQDGYPQIFLSEKYVNESDLLKQIQNFDEKGILDLNDLENERVENIASELNIDSKDIQSIDEIDLEQLINDRYSKLKNEKESTEELLQKGSTNKKIKTNKKEDRVKLSEKQLEELSVKEETSLSQEIKGVTLGEKLGLQKKGITGAKKLARISISGPRKDAFVAINSDGTATVLGEDILEPDTRTGTTPMATSMTINNDGIVNQESVTSSYRIVNGNGNEYLRAGYDESYGKEIKYSMFSKEKNEYLDIELETQRTRPKDSTVRQFMRDKGAGIREAESVIERGEEHQFYGEMQDDSEHKLNIRDVDNNKNNDTHEHLETENGKQTLELGDYIPNTNITWENFANMCGYRGEGRLDKAVKRFKEEQEKDHSISNKEIMDEIEEKENEQYRGNEIER